MPLENLLPNTRWHLEQVTRESFKIMRIPRDLHGHVEQENNDDASTNKEL